MIYFPIILQMCNFGFLLLGFCDFENDYCTWTQEPTRDVFDWLRSQGSTDSTGTGPSKDHTTGTSLGNTSKYLHLKKNKIEKQLACIVPYFHALP